MSGRAEALSSHAWRRGAVAPCALALLALAVQTPAALRDDSAEGPRAVLLQRGALDVRDEEQLAAELADLGSTGVPALFALCSGPGLERLLAESAPETTDSKITWCVAPDRIPALAQRALARMPAEDVIPVLSREALGGTLETRVCALRVLGALGSAEGLELVLEIATRAGDLAVRYPSVRKPLVEALAAVLRGDAPSWSSFRERVSELPPTLLPVLIEAVTLSGRASGFRVLEELAGHDAELDLLVAESATELAWRFPWILQARAAQLLHRLLGATDWRLRRAGAAGLGRIHDLESFEDLVALLDDEQHGVRLAARRALEDLLGEPLGLPGTASASYVAQLSWWEDSGRALIEREDVLLPGGVAEIVRAFERRALLRHEAAELLAAGLWEGEPRSVQLLSRFLGKLGSQRAVPGLVDVLVEHEDEGARRAAWEALRLLTKTELPLEAEVWQEYLRG